MKDYIDVRVTMDQIKQALKSMIKDNPHKDLIVNTIVEGLVETEVGLSHLYNAFSGVKSTVHVKVGDDVLVKYEHLPTWRMDREKMQANGEMEKGYVKCTVIEINLQKLESIIVSFKYYESSGKDVVTTYSLLPDRVHLNNEEYPEGFNKSE